MCDLKNLAMFSGDGSQSSMGGGAGGDAFGGSNFSMGDFGNAAAGAGGLIEAWGSIRAGNASAALAELQSGLFASNAALLRKQADVAELGVDLAYAKGRESESRVRIAGEAVEGQQRHWYASNYLDPAYGSPLLHQALTAGQIEHDVGIVRATAQIEAADAKTRVAVLIGKAGEATVNSEMQKVKGSEARLAGYVGAATAFLKTAGKMASAGAGG